MEKPKRLTPQEKEALKAYQEQLLRKKASKKGQEVRAVIAQAGLESEERYRRLKSIITRYDKKVSELNELFALFSEDKELDHKILVSFFKQFSEIEWDVDALSNLLDQLEDRQNSLKQLCVDQLRDRLSQLDPIEVEGLQLIQVSSIVTTIATYLQDVASQFGVKTVDRRAVNYCVRSALNYRSTIAQYLVERSDKNKKVLYIKKNDIRTLVNRVFLYD